MVNLRVITILNEHGAKVPLMARRAKKVKTGLASANAIVCLWFVYLQSVARYGNVKNP